MSDENITKRLTADNDFFEIAALSALGDRDEQQDHFGFELTDDECTAIVCDGMGGYEGGQLASSAAVDEFASSFKKHRENSALTDALQKAVLAANARVSALKTDEGAPLKAGTTLTAVSVTGKKLLWVSVGDSRGYLFRNGEYVQFTTDHNYHTVLKEQINAELISEEEYYRELVRADALISYVGISELKLIDYSKDYLELRSGDVILLMTDGIYRLVNDREMLSVLGSGEPFLSELENRANKDPSFKGVRDNMTVIKIRIK